MCIAEGSVFRSDSDHTSALDQKAALVGIAEVNLNVDVGGWPKSCRQQEGLSVGTRSCDRALKCTTPLRFLTAGALVAKGAPTQPLMRASDVKPVAFKANDAPSNDVKHWASLNVFSAVSGARVRTAMLVLLETSGDELPRLESVFPHADDEGFQFVVSGLWVVEPCEGFLVPLDCARTDVADELTLFDELKLFNHFVLQGRGALERPNFVSD